MLEFFFANHTYQDSQVLKLEILGCERQEKALKDLLPLTPSPKPEKPGEGGQRLIIQKCLDHQMSQSTSPISAVPDFMFLLEAEGVRPIMLIVQQTGFCW